MSQKHFEESATPFDGPEKDSPPINPKVKLKKIGNSLGVTLPKKLLNAKSYEEGMEFSLVESPDGLILKPYNAEFERRMEIAKRIMARDRNILRELAK